MRSAGVAGGKSPSAGARLRASGHTSKHGEGRRHALLGHRQARLPSLPVRACFERRHVHVHATLAGHSLGGALATLAAYDLATELALPHVHCVTFGAPRVGNSVFVSDYDRHVPDTWCPHRSCPVHMHVGGQ